jgi:16S rRNA (guanine966-N2)-methyltransferase
MRQAVFSSLAARLTGATFVDLFAGSGSYGLEALSRGARNGYFVEKNAKAAACIRQNITAVCKSMAYDETALAVVQADAVTWVKNRPNVLPDLVFIDPPYELIAEVGPVLFGALAEWLEPKEDPVIVFEMPGELSLDAPRWECVRRLGKGARQPTVAFFKKRSKG